MNKHKQQKKQSFFQAVGISECVGIVFLIGSACWFYWVAPTVAHLPHNFSFEADVISIDNFYDEEAASFQGPQRSVTRLNYDVVDITDGILTINNSFSVRSVSGEPIFSVERLYGIDPSTKQHVAGYGDHARNGYLFAPPGVQPGESFTYWHVNYDGPAQMNYVGEEELFGLNVFKYESDYSATKIDQTEQLSGLPDVGETRGIELEPKLTLWVEPQTGLLVNYQDETIAYYYDLASGERQNPWNKFSNKLLNSSVKEHAQYALDTEVKYETARYVVPFILFGTGVAFLLLKRHRRIGHAIVLVVFAGALIFTYRLSTVSVSQPVLRVGISRFVPLGNEAYNDNIAGFKEALMEAGFVEGETIEYIERTADSNLETQEQIAREFLNEELDLIYSLTTPGTAALKEITASIPIVFSIVTYPVEAGLIDSLVSSGNNIVGTRNWVPAEEQLQNFLQLVPTTKTIGFIHRTGEINSTIQLGEMQEAAASRGVEIISVNAPDVDSLEQQLTELPSGVDALYSSCDTLVQGQAEGLIIEYAHSKELPSFSCNASGPERGDLIGTVADFRLIGKLSGQKAARIFEGYQPLHLSTETAARSIIVINESTAARLGISIPQDVRATAREVYR